MQLPCTDVCLARHSKQVCQVFKHTLWTPALLGMMFIWVSVNTFSSCKRSPMRLLTAYYRVVSSRSAWACGCRGGPKKYAIIFATRLRPHCKAIIKAMGGPLHLWWRLGQYVTGPVPAACSGTHAPTCSLHRRPSHAAAFACQSSRWPGPPAAQS